MMFFFLERDVSKVLPLCQKFRKVKWKGPFRFHPTAIFGSTSGGGVWRWSSFIVGTGQTEICRSILTNRFIALLLFSRFQLRGGYEKGRENNKSHSSRLARFDRKMSFHSLWLVPLVSDRSVWYNGKHLGEHFCK